MWLKIVLEVKTKRGLNVIEKNIDEQIETMTRVVSQHRRFDRYCLY